MPANISFGAVVKGREEQSSVELLNCSGDGLLDLELASLPAWASVDVVPVPVDLSAPDFDPIAPPQAWRLTVRVLNHRLESGINEGVISVIARGSEATHSLSIPISARLVPSVQATPSLLFFRSDDSSTLDTAVVYFVFSAGVSIPDIASIVISYESNAHLQFAVDAIAHNRWKLDVSLLKRPESLGLKGMVRVAFSDSEIADVCLPVCGALSSQ